jgi:hypothetical protein
MKLGLMTGYSGSKVKIPLDVIRHAEALGYDSVWTAEAYGADAVSTAAWILANTTRIRAGTAIMQMPARTPAMAAMTAMTLAHLSGNRFIVGLGASGPQVVEGWHGVAYGKPVTRLKEYIQIMQQIFAREAPVSFEGEMYQLPYRGPGATGLGKPLKSILHCDARIPIYSANITPAGVMLATPRWPTASSRCGWIPSASTSSNDRCKRVSRPPAAASRWPTSMSRPSCGW